MKIATVWNAIKNSLKAIRNGEFLLRIRADKWFVHVLYLFLLMWITIFLSLKVDDTLTKAGNNRAAIEELEVRHAQKEAALVKLRSASSIQEKLEKMGSATTLPTEPASRIKGRR